MARVARSKHSSSIVSIVQKTDVQCFRDDHDRNTFIDILQKAQSTYQFQCYAFCLLNDHAFRLIIDTKGRNISKIMQSITITYAMYRQAKTKLFPQRFKSKPLLNQEDVLNEIGNINQKTHTRYNSYCIYHEKLSSDLDFMSLVLPHSFKITTETVPSMSDEEVIAKVHDYLHRNQCTLDDLKRNKQKRNQCLLELRRELPCSLKQLGIAFGGLSESTVSKILKQMEQTD